ncbi:MAG: ATP-dependent Clp protease ATP-binding subunit [Bacteroidales bacterium]|nr:ATP-dependent Clp protease ATP-binding subunit [Bacteroidales bacterium]
MIDKIKKIAGAFAEDHMSDAVYPAHLFKAVLHKEAGLVSFIESDLDKDYYYLQDWADRQIQLMPRAARPKRCLELSDESVAVFEEAEEYKLKFGLDECTPVCVLAALVTPGVGFTFDQLKTLPLSAEDIASRFEKAGVSAAASEGNGASRTGGLSKYCTEKVALAREGRLDKVIGMDAEVERICGVMGRMNKANMIVTGDAGVGKTSLINAFVQRIADGEVPGFLKDALVYELELSDLGGDAQYKGEVDDRFKSVLNDLAAIENSILLIESVDKLFDKQGALYGASALLKAALAKGTVRLLSTSSVEGFTKNIETDKEMVSKLDRLNVEAPDDAMCLEILRGSISKYEEFHGVSVPEEILPESIRLAKRYMTERSLPDSAFDLLDRAMVSVKSATDGREMVLAADDICTIISKQSGIPLGKVQTSERDRLMNAEDTLKQRVVGQDHAVRKVLDSVFESRSGLNKKGQPMGSFFFLGPTGTGKTELSKALAQFLFGDESALVRFDMSEFKEEHSVALLYGAPPGYVGYEEGGLLVNKIRQHPYSVVLFDEIEKAHKSVFDLFLQILDEGKLHDRLGRVGDFSNALILFTSNIGSQFIVDKFTSGVVPDNNDLMDIMQNYFRPEFLGRLTEIVPFSPITEKTVTRIFDIHLKGLLKLLAEQNIKLEMDEETKTKVAMMGFNPQYGARPVLGIIRKQLRNPLSKMIISGEVKSGDTVVLSFEDGKPVFSVKNK